MPLPSPRPPGRTAPALPGVRTAPAVRTAEVDRCPGVLRLHEAADGGLARIRVPGGLLEATQVEALADATDRLGDGDLHVTARGNLEIRAVDGVGGAGALAERLAVAALLPSATHERVRNVLASPLAGLDGRGSGPLAEQVRRLDAAVRATPALAALSGRFLFGLDDGRGDVLAMGPDVGTLAGEQGVHLVLGGELTDVVVEEEHTAEVVVLAATEFLRLADEGAWRIVELGEARNRVIAAIRDAVRARVPTRRHPPPRPADDGMGPLPGPHPHGRHSTLCAGLPLGSAGADTWRALASVAASGDGLVRITPWRGVVLGGLATAGAGAAVTALADEGLILDPADPRHGLTACTGRPGCAKARADVRAEALAFPQEGRGPGRPLRVHRVGCERACGRPPGSHTLLVAIGDGPAPLTPPCP